MGVGKLPETRFLSRPTSCYGCARRQVYLGWFQEEARRMSDSTTKNTGPKKGLSAEEFEQVLRDAEVLLADECEQPRSLFLALQYENGTDYLQAHTETQPTELDQKVYDLFSPLAVHIQEVASEANTDVQTAVECAVEILETMDRPDRVDETH